MKKIITIIVLGLVLFLVSGKNIDTKDEVRGVFISYIEEKKYLEEDQVKTKKNIDKIINNIKNNKFNLIILQVRSNSDSIYKSKYFPTSSIINGEEGIEYFDVLDYFIKESHKNNILVYAWINPYRVRTNNNIDSISINNPAYKYINSDYLYIDEGIYYNPSKIEVEDLIVGGVEEIVSNYKVDGILFDDYFYPASDVDIEDYYKYIKDNGYIDLDTYHLNIISKMIKRVHEVCSKYNVEFGVSPDGNINNNYEELYADILLWLSEKDYVDFIMPQVYYGFFNEAMPFYETINNWNSYIKNKDIKLYIALALYKSGNIDKYAKNGSNEWVENNNILMREVILSRNLSNYHGFSLFRYENMYNEGNISEEIINLNKILSN